MCPCLSKAESREHRAWSIGKDRRQKTEDRGQKTEILLWERLSAAILRFQLINDFYDFNDFNDLNGR